MTNQTKKHRQAASMGYRDFNRLASREYLTSPLNDSPGDTADDELIEMNLGQTYYPQYEGDDEVLADSSAQEEEGETPEMELDEEAGAVFSERPDPIEDLDRPTSTH